MTLAHHLYNAPDHLRERAGEVEHSLTRLLRDEHRITHDGPFRVEMHSGPFRGVLTYGSGDAVAWQALSDGVDTVVRPISAVIDGVTYRLTHEGRLRRSDTQENRR